MKTTTKISNAARMADAMAILWKAYDARVAEAMAAPRGEKRIAWARVESARDRITNKPMNGY